MSETKKTLLQSIGKEAFEWVMVLVIITLIFATIHLIASHVTITFH